LLAPACASISALIVTICTNRLVVVVMSAPLWRDSRKRRRRSQS